MKIATKRNRLATGVRRWHRGSLGHRALGMISAIVLVLSLSPLFTTGSLAQQSSTAPKSARIDITVLQCAPSNESPAQVQQQAYDDLKAGCTTPDRGVALHLANTSTNDDAKKESDTQGKVSYPNLAPGSYTAYTDIPRGSATEVVWCVADGGTPYQKTFNENIVTTFEDLQTDQVSCSWFVVPTASGAAAAATPATDDAISVPTLASATSTPATSTPTTEASLADIRVNLLACPDDAGLDANSAYSDLAATCTTPDPGVTVHFGDTSNNDDSPKQSDNQGAVDYPNLQPGTYTAYTDIQRGTATEVVWCVANGGNPYQKTFNENVVTTFEGLQTEQIVCSWFVIPTQSSPTVAPTTVPPTATATPTQVPPTSVPPTATATPTQAPPTATPTTASGVGAAQSGSASIGINLLSCPEGTSASSDYTTLSQNCTAADPGVTVHLTNTGTNVDDPQASGQDGTVTYGDLAAGTYTAYTDIPRATATEVLWCVDNNGAPYQKTFNENVVTTFEDVQSDVITCSWFVIPTAATPTQTPAPTATTPSGDRTTQTGGSVIVHLASCPTGYSGDQLFDDCHGNGIANMEFDLSGPGGTQTQNTTRPEDPGPGIVTFTGLQAGDYTVTGGPPGDFGTVRLYCTSQPDGTPIDANLDGTKASFTLSANENVLCDWYYIPENLAGSSPTPSPTTAATAAATATPTQAPRAQILVTLYSCPAATNGTSYGGATYDQFTKACTTPVNDVPFTLGDVDAPPLSANTGVSGDGAVKFYDLLPADYTLSPTLSSNLTTAGVFCTLNGGDRYQKALSNGSVTFANVNGNDNVTCDWFAVAPPAKSSGPTGSITVVEKLCSKDQSEIKDWDSECTAGTSGGIFQLTSTDNSINQSGSTDKNGQLVFKGLPDAHYSLKETNGSWCHATANRVDSQSRVIVQDGGNTNVFLYQCGSVTSLPNTGTGTPISRNESSGVSAMVLASIFLAVLAAGIGSWTLLRSRRPRRRPVPVQRESGDGPVQLENGMTWMRFR